MRIDDELAVADPVGRQDYRFSAAQVISTIRNNAGRSAPRTTMPCSYWTPTANPTVYFTALRSNGTVLVARSTSGVTLANSLYHASVTLEAGMTVLTAVWDEGNVNDFVSEEIVVDT